MSNIENSENSSGLISVDDHAIILRKMYDVFNSRFHVITIPRVEVFPLANQPGVIDSIQLFACKEDLISADLAR